MELRLFDQGIPLRIVVTDEGDVRLYAEQMPDSEQAHWYRLVEVQLTGAGVDCHHGRKHTGTLPGARLRYAAHSDERNQYGRKLTITQTAGALTAVSHMQCYGGLPVVRCWTTLENAGEPVTAEYVSSFALTGLLSGEADPRDNRAVVHIPHNTWYGEAQWKSSALAALGYDAVLPTHSMKRIATSGTGSWACAEHLPMGALTNAAGTRTCLWQIETSGSWHWELSDIGGQLYVQLSGPTWQESGWRVTLGPGERFESVPCAVALVEGDFTRAVQAMTRYRRLIRHKNADNEHEGVIFNDYMNCLMGDPTFDAELPLIDAAARAGCAYYCVDAGWYADGEWWDGVGEWLPSRARFPDGLKPLMDRIRERGMTPGLWLELEVMGVNCPLAEGLPDDWFFLVDGKRVIDEGRYQLDFSNPAVARHADAILDRLVNEYGARYIKMDYNINIGLGTERGVVCAGQGLLRHTRAYLRWLDAAFARYPGLIIENCSSGGMRMEYSLLSRHQIQSVTDQTDYVKMAAIACNCMTAVTPEQAAIWSYPMRGGDLEETAFNMVSAMLFRIHQSGHLAELSPERFELVREGIRVHRLIAPRIRRGVPFWPMGLASFDDEYCAVGVACEGTRYLALWHMGGADQQARIRMPEAAGSRAALLYPAALPRDWAWNADQGVLVARMAPRTACVFSFEPDPDP